MGRPKKSGASAAVASKKVPSLDGFHDIITEHDPLWDALLRQLQRMSRVYGFAHMDTPMLEDLNLFQNFYRDPLISETLATVAGSSRTAAMRPSLLPGILRAYGQHKIYDAHPLSKWSYHGPVMHRSPKTEKLSEDVEFGFEVFGSFNHLTEAQVVGVVWELLGSLGLKEVSLEINNIGNVECQVTYQETLHDFLASKKYELCDACGDSLNGRVLNVFRCENLDCQALVSEAPAILDFLDPESHAHFTSILEALDELNAPYQLNPLLAGPDGYSQTNFIIKYKNKGQTITLGEGGYHTDLLQSVSGKTYSCFGFSGSLLKIMEALQHAKIVFERESRNDVFLVPLGELASKKSLRLFHDLTSQRISVYDHFGTAGVKNQLKQAETFKAPIALIMGQKEAIDEMVILRDVKSGMQEIISYDKIVEEVKKRLGR